MKNKNKKSYGILLSALSVLLICVIAYFCHLYTLTDVPYQFLSAILGAAITILITFLLLQSQDKSELSRTAKSKIYEEKLRIYQEYLQTLCNAIEDRQLSDDEKIRLQFQTSYIAMHTSDEHIANISKSVEEILKCVCLEPNKPYDVEKLQKELFNVVLYFQEEIYEDKTPNKKCRDDASKFFSQAFEAFESSTENVNAESTISIESLQESVANSGDTKVEIWDNARKEWEAKGWKINADGFEYKEIEKGEAKVQYGFYDGHYYVQAVYGTNVSFSKFLKEKEACGSRRYGLWWWHLDKFYNLQENDATKYFPTSKELQDCLADWFSYLVDVCERQAKASLWEDMLKKKYGESSSCYTWHWGTVCEIDDGSENNPYIFAYKDGNYKNSNNTIQIMLGVNKNDSDKLRNLLPKANVNNEIIDVDKFNMVLLEVLPDSATDDVIVQNIRKWFEKINGLK